MFLSSLDAEEFVKLCREKKIPIYGFDGFFLLPNRHVQIEQDMSADYSNIDHETAYELALKFFEKHRESGVGYEIVYDDPDMDWEVIKARDQNRPIRTNEQIINDINEKRYL